MFKSWSKSRDIITLFHKPSSQSSVRVLNMLKQASAAASETATVDQASDHSSQNKMQRIEFDLDITENPPTKDQLQTILEYVGAKQMSSIVKGATGKADAMQKFGENSNNFLRPIVVDWTNGKASAVPGEEESEMLRMLGQQPGFGKQQ